MKVVTLVFACFLLITGCAGLSTTVPETPRQQYLVTLAVYKNTATTFKQLIETQTITDRELIKETFNELEKVKTYLDNFGTLLETKDSISDSDISKLESLQNITIKIQQELIKRECASSDPSIECPATFE